MKLIPQWRRAWRMFSVQAMTLAGAVQAAWALMPEDLKAQLPAGLVPVVSIVLLVAGIAGRMVQQPKVTSSHASAEEAQASWLPANRRRP